MIIVPMDTPGIEVQGIWTMSNIRTNAVFFDNVRVPRDHLIGERGMGFYYAMMALDFERIQIGCVGMLARLLEELKDVVRRTTRDGRAARRHPVGAARDRRPRDARRGGPADRAAERVAHRPGRSCPPRKARCPRST